jgi:hypothetical protein
MYLTTTRSDIAFVVSLLSRFMHCASESHLQGAKRIVRYINGTINYDIKFFHSHNFMLHGYFDNDWAGSMNDNEKHFGLLF